MLQTRERLAVEQAFDDEADEEACRCREVARPVLALDVLDEQYITTARAKGLAERWVIYKYAVRVAINPMISILGLQMPQLVSGSIIVAIVLGLPTTGPLFYRALETQDMYLAGTFLMLFAILLVLGNLMADILLAWADPRIRLE